MQESWSMRLVMLRIAALLLMFSAPAVAQQSPHVAYVYPAGGRPETTFQVTVGGQYLDGVSNVHFTGAGIGATVIRHERQLTPKEQDELKKQLADLQEKRKQGTALSDTERQQADEIKRRLTQFGRRLPNPGLSEYVTLQVTIAANAKDGEREIRLITPNGLSNPLVFCVGLLPEYSKDDWKNVPADRSSMDPKLSPAHTETHIVLPATVNGQVEPGGSERYRFHARKGQSLVFIANARSLIPFIADAVPGWFQATLTLFDAHGKELAHSEGFRFSQDPVLHYVVPDDGEYSLEIRDSLYRGRDDFVYRVSMGEFPFITDVFPLGTHVGTAAAVQLTGWNLAVATLSTTPRTTGVTSLALPSKVRPSNSVPFIVDNLPECLDHGSNDTPATAQAVTIPTIINGRIAHPGEQHTYRFDGHSGEAIVAEVMARRLGSPLDSILTLTDANGKQIAVNDDFIDKGTGSLTHQADSLIAITLPAEGAYYLNIADTQEHGGPEYAYRLRISTPHPDYELRVTPSSINARGGTTTTLTVYALRKDSFTGEITMAIKDAPAGFSLGGARIPAGHDRARITLTIPPDASSVPFSPHIEGRANIAGHEVTHPALPAEDMMQAFAYHDLVPVQELLVAAFDRPAIRYPLALLDATPVHIPADGTARIHISLPPAISPAQARFELSDPPAGLTIEGVTPFAQGAQITLKCDSTKAQPGLKGALIITASAEPPTSRDKGGETRRQMPLGDVPAIPFVITSR